MSASAGRRATDGAIPRAVWRVAAIAMLGPVMTNLDATIVTVSLTSLGRSLHAPLGETQWVTSGYLLALALALPLSGWLVDRHGTRRVYRGCFAAFTLASLLCAASPTIGALIGARVAQGLCGGILAPLAQMMIARVAGPSVGRVMGVAIVPVLIGPIFGPVLGGAIVAFCDWRWLFLINLPVGALGIWAATRLPTGERNPAATPRALDLRGLLLLSPGLVLCLLGLDRLAVSPIAGAALLLAGGALLTAFLRHARRMGGAALLDLRITSAPGFRPAALAQFIGNGVILGGQVLLPIVLLRGGASTSMTGLLLGATGIGGLCSYPLVGTLIHRLGPRRVLLLGGGLMLLGTTPFLLRPGGDLPMGVVVASLAVRGLGIGGLALPCITVAYAALPGSALPNATTLLNIAQRLGGPVATTLLALLLSRGDASSGTAIAALMALTAATGACAAFFPARAGPLAAAPTELAFDEELNDAM